MYLFKSQEEKTRLSNVKNLITLAMADGSVDKDELAAIAVVAARDNVSINEVKKMLMGKDKVKFVVPKTQQEKVKCLKDMVCLMMVDGHVHELEITLCRLIATHFGYSDEVIDAMILDIVDEISGENE